MSRRKLAEIGSKLPPAAGWENVDEATRHFKVSAPSLAPEPATVFEAVFAPISYDASLYERLVSRPASGAGSACGIVRLRLRERRGLLD